MIGADGTKVPGRQDAGVKLMHELAHSLGHHLQLRGEQAVGSVSSLALPLALDEDRRTYVTRHAKQASLKVRGRPATVQ
jgi:hypothetical protein